APARPGVAAEVAGPCVRVPAAAVVVPGVGVAPAHHAGRVAAEEVVVEVHPGRRPEEAAEHAAEEPAAATTAIPPAAVAATATTAPGQGADDPDDEPDAQQDAQADTNPAADAHTTRLLLVVGGLCVRLHRNDRVLQVADDEPDRRVQGVV